MHLVPEGMSVSYGLRSPSHVQEEYLTPARLSLIPSRALQEHLGGPEAQLSPTEHLVALEKNIIEKKTAKHVAAMYVYWACLRDNNDIALTRPDVEPAPLSTTKLYRT